MSGTGRTRLVLATEDDRKPFLRRWGWRCRLGGVYLHHLAEPDPGVDLHDHPWPFVSIVLKGGYTDEVMEARQATQLARATSRWGAPVRGILRHHRARRWHVVRTTTAHRISHVMPGTWTLVLRGTERRQWGFYTPEGYEESGLYHMMNHDAGRIRLNQDGTTQR